LVPGAGCAIRFAAAIVALAFKFAELTVNSHPEATEVGVASGIGAAALDSGAAGSPVDCPAFGAGFDDDPESVLDSPSVANNAKPITATATPLRTFELNMPFSQGVPRYFRD